MNKDLVTEFFNSVAEKWDALEIKSADRVYRILDYAGVAQGMKVLDVACGTGVLVPDYLARNVGEVCGVDISSKMIEIARGKFNFPNVKFICSDVEKLAISGFDVCVVYNAFPHFENPARLIENLSEKLKDGGRLTIAHGMSRDEINNHHKGCPAGISNELMECKKLGELFAPHFTVDVCVEDEIYVVSGIKKQGK
ncbi:MAG: methyltransferase domain-containing protein [Clostridia bacterium]|nr:methyltransferase domain-containing protein [Clostridia bacterium]